MLPQGLEPWGDRRVWLTSSGALATAARRSRHRDPRPSARIRPNRPSRSLRARIDRLPAWPGRLAELEASGRIASASPGGRGAPLSGRPTSWRPGPVAELAERCGRSKAGRALVAFLAEARRPATGSELQEAGASEAVLRRLVTLGVLRQFLATRAAGPRAPPDRFAPGPAGADRAPRRPGGGAGGDRRRALGAALRAVAAPGGHRLGQDRGLPAGRGVRGRGRDARRSCWCPRSRWFPRWRARRGSASVAASRSCTPASAAASGNRSGSGSAAAKRGWWSGRARRCSPRSPTSG